MAEETAPIRKKRGPGKPFPPGVSGNPAGRPKGARCTFAQDFVLQFAAHWSKNGEKVLNALAKKKPQEYARVACAIIPKVIEFDEETRDVLGAIAAQIPFEKI